MVLYAFVGWIGEDGKTPEIYFTTDEHEAQQGLTRVECKLRGTSIREQEEARPALADELRKRLEEAYTNRVYPFHSRA